MSKIIVKKLNTFSGHQDSIYTLEKSNSDHTFFSGAGDGMVVEWDLLQPDQGKLVAKVEASIYALKYLPEINLMAVGHNYQGVHFIDMVSKKEIGSLKCTEAAIFDFAIFNDYILAATAKGELLIIDPLRHTLVDKIKIADQSLRVMAVNIFSGDIAIGSSDHHIYIIDGKKGQLKQVLKGHTNSVFTLTYSPDGSYLLSGSRDAHLKIWKVDSNYSLHQDIVAHMYAINHITYSPDRKYFATASMDKSIKVWDADDFRLVKVIDKARHAGHGTSVNKLLWSSYDNVLISGSDDRSISVWDLDFKALM
jgi:WD40 repeat protein